MSISVEMCLGGRELTEPRLSPDGATVAFVVRWGANAAIVAMPVDGGAERLISTEPPPAPGRGMGGGCFSWLPDGSGLIYAARDGNLWRQPFPGGPACRISDVAAGRRHEAPCVTPSGDAVISVVDQAEVWRHELDAEGEAPPRRLDDAQADFVFDPFVTSCGTTLLWTAWNVPDMPWDAARVETLVFESGERGQFVGPTSVHQPRTLPDGRGLGVRDDHGWLNVFVGDEPLIDEPYEHAGPTWGMGQRSYAHSPDGTQIAFTRNEGGFGRLCVADVETRAMTDVARGVHGQLSWSGGRLTALRTGARTPTQIVSYDSATWQRTVLAFGPVGGWEAAELPEPELIEVPHGTAVLHARRYVAGHGRTLCWVHGGPTDQWQVEFMPRIAYWWSKGWDVLAIDPRGSTGHGRAYQQALREEWGRLDVDDAAVILRWSHDSGASSPDHTVMMGSSSGGLTALGVLGRHPGIAAGGVVLYPVTDLAVLADESHRFEAHYTLSLVGPLDDHDRYWQRSPMSYASEIDTPLLIMHGDADPVVPIDSTIDFVDRMRRAGRSPELVIMEGEGHGFRSPDNKRAEYRLTEEFLAQFVAAG